MILIFHLLFFYICNFLKMIKKRFPSTKQKFLLCQFVPNYYCQFWLLTRGCEVILLFLFLSIKSIQFLLSGTNYNIILLYNSVLLSCVRDNSVIFYCFFFSFISVTFSFLTALFNFLLSAGFLDCCQYFLVFSLFSKSRWFESGRNEIVSDEFSIIFKFLERVGIPEIFRNFENPKLI